MASLKLVGEYLTIPEAHQVCFVLRKRIGKTARFRLLSSGADPRLDRTLLADFDIICVGSLIYRVLPRCHALFSNPYAKRYIASSLPSPLKSIAKQRRHPKNIDRESSDLPGSIQPVLPLPFGAGNHHLTLDFDTALRDDLFK